MNWTLSNSSTPEKEMWKIKWKRQCCIWIINLKPIKSTVYLRTDWSITLPHRIPSKYCSIELKIKQNAVQNIFWKKNPSSVRTLGCPNHKYIKYTLVNGASLRSFFGSLCIFQTVEMETDCLIYVLSASLSWHTAVMDLCITVLVT